MTGEVSQHRAPGACQCAAGHIAAEHGICQEVLNVVSELNAAGHDDRPANLILIEQSGAKRAIALLSAANGMVEAQQAMHHPGLHLREVKVVSRHTAIARWKAGELGWRRVA